VGRRDARPHPNIRVDSSALTGGAGRDQDSAAGRDIPACDDEEGNEVGSG